MKKTKIICTIGPQTESEFMLTKLLNLGMNVMRLNFSHGNYIEHGKRIFNLRQVLKKTGFYAAIMLDTQGPEIRTKKLYKGLDVLLQENQIFRFISDKEILGNYEKVSVNYKNFAKDIKIDSIILVDDGLIKMKVLDINNNDVICKVLNTGYLGENKGINLPGISLNLPTLSKKDKNDLIFGCKEKVDFIAASFIRKSSDILKIRDFLNQNNGKNINVIAKIENQEGLNNFEEILNVSDGIMVARGDLGVEIPIEEVIFAQKMIIKKCNYVNKIVITATQMLDSMIHKPRPTRAEATDIANAIIDGTDAVMLSGESAKGKYPIESVNIMSKICERTDKDIIPNNINIKKHLSKRQKMIESICKGAVETAKNLQSPLIIIETKSGNSAKIMRKYCPQSLILALTTNYKISCQLMVMKGIYTYHVEKLNNIDDFYRLGKKIALEKNYAKKNQIIVMVSKLEKKENINDIIKTISVHTL